MQIGLLQTPTRNNGLSKSVPETFLGLEKTLNFLASNSLCWALSPYTRCAGAFCSSSRPFCLFAQAFKPQNCSFLGRRLAKRNLALLVLMNTTGAFTPLQLLFQTLFYKKSIQPSPSQISDGSTVRFKIQTFFFCIFPALCPSLRYLPSVISCIWAFST